MNKLTKVEKVMIAHVDIGRYNTYRCEQHGVYQIRKDVDDRKCPWCKKEHDLLPDIEQLQKQYKTKY